MNNAKHTPGPWYLEEVGYSSSSYYIRGSFDSGARHTIGKGAVAHIPRSTVNPMEANARLIAAAPELLEACKSLLTLTQLMANEAYYDESIVEFEIFSEKTKSTRCLVLVFELAKARAAIAKATGAASSAAQAAKENK